MRTNGFSRTREDHSRETGEDYVELVAALILEKGEARTVDLAERLAISHVSVSKTLQRLHREGLVIALPYKSILLTDEGQSVANKAGERHTLVHDFLVRLGVQESVAEIDAEGIEHHVSQETLEAMANYLNLNS